MTLPASLDRLAAPIIAAPLFIVSTPEPVMAQCCAGIITTDYFSAVPANFLAASIERAGLDLKQLKRDPDERANVSPSGNSHKTWRDIWGCGHGVGRITDIIRARERVARLIAEYHSARRSIPQ